MKKNRIKRKITISPIFILLIIFSSFFGYLRCAVLSVIFSLLHEFAHIFCARNFGYELNEIKLMPYGAMLCTGERFKRNEGLRIALAGPIFSLLIALIVVALWWLFPPLYSLTEDIFLINILLCVVNLLPIFPLDGSRILLSLFGGKKTITLLRISGILFSVLFLLVFMMSAFCVEFTINYSYAVMSLLFLSGVILEPKKLAMRRVTESFSNEKRYASGVKVEKILISEQANLYKVLRLLEVGKIVELVVLDGENRPICVANEHIINEWFVDYELNTRLQVICSDNEFDKERC